MDWVLSDLCKEIKRGNCGKSLYLLNDVNVLIRGLSQLHVKGASLCFD